MAAPEAPPEGGKGKRRILGMPPWALAVVGGAVVGAWWYLRRARQQSAQQDTAAADTSGEVPTTIVPTGGTLSEGQYQGILDAIHSINGPGSQPVDDDDDPEPPGATVPGRPPITKPAPTPHRPVGGQKAYTAYRVKRGDTLTSIAHKYGTTAAKLYAYNIGASSPHTAKAKALLRKRGPDLIFSGEEIDIPNIYIPKK